METSYFHHALKIVKEACIGCAHCMNVCPTEAIRLRDGKAQLHENRCVDCGECFRACPVNAIIVEHDDFNHIYDFEYRVALVPAVLIGQFPEEVKTTKVYSALKELGFTHVYEVEHGADFLIEAINSYQDKNDDIKPLISSFCPAVVRMIQVKFPALTENIIHLKAPLDIAAIDIREQLTGEGIDERKLGIFYVTPCAAKIAAVKSPVGQDKSPIDGVINMDFIFNKIYKKVVESPKDDLSYHALHQLTGKDILWSLTSGEADNFEGRCLSIDEIQNVMEFLEKVENEEVSDIDFLELRACDQSCAGGVLNPTNRFLTVERLKKRAKKLDDRGVTSERSNSLDIDDPKIVINEIKPRSMHKLDEDMGEAMKKMSQVNEIMSSLPDVDCAACGAPSCQALAEDIVKGEAGITDCIFVQRGREKRGLISPEESVERMGKIWGEDKLNKSC